MGILKHVCRDAAPVLTHERDAEGASDGVRVGRKSGRRAARPDDGARVLLACARHRAYRREPRLTVRPTVQ